MPSSHRQKPKAKPASKRPAASRRAVPAARPTAGSRGGKPAPKVTAKAAPKGRTPPAAKASAAPKAPTAALEVPSPDGRRHVLSLSFVRDGEDFLARLETDVGHITELKNRSLDQLLTLVASELEDLLE